MLFRPIIMEIFVLQKSSETFKPLKNFEINTLNIPSINWIGSGILASGISHYFLGASVLHLQQICYSFHRNVNVLDFVILIVSVTVRMTSQRDWGQLISTFARYAWNIPFPKFFSRIAKSSYGLHCRKRNKPVAFFE